MRFLIKRYLHRFDIFQYLFSPIFLVLKSLMFNPDYQGEIPLSVIIFVIILSIMPLVWLHRFFLVGRYYITKIEKTESGFKVFFVDGLKRKELTTKKVQLCNIKDPKIHLPMYFFIFVFRGYIFTFDDRTMKQPLTLDWYHVFQEDLDNFFEEAKNGEILDIKKVTEKNKDITLKKREVKRLEDFKNRWRR